MGPIEGRVSKEPRKSKELWQEHAGRGRSGSSTEGWIAPEVQRVLALQSISFTEEPTAPTESFFEGKHFESERRYKRDLKSEDPETGKNAEHVAGVVNLGGTLLVYEPEFGEGRGRAVSAFGDMATADYVGVLVPGIGNSLKTFDKLADRARDLYTECVRTRPDAEVAIVAWMGYKAPRVAGDGRESCRCGGGC